MDVLRNVCGNIASNLSALGDLAGWDKLVLAVYFAALFFVGFWTMKKSGKNTKEYFLSGQSMSWWLLGFSLVATTFAADTPNFVTELVRTKGVSANWSWWAFLLTGMTTVFIYAKLKFGLCNYDAASESVVCTFLVKSDGCILDGGSVLKTFSGELLFKNLNGSFKGNVLVMISDLSLCAGCVNRLGEFFRFLESFGKSDTAHGTVLLVACPAAACNIASYNALKRHHAKLFAHHTVSRETWLSEKLRHIVYIY